VAFVTFPVFVIDAFSLVCTGALEVLTFPVFVIDAFSLVCTALEALLLLVLDVHPATRTVKDSSAITRPVMKTRFFSIISPLQCLLFMLMGVSQAIISIRSLSSPWSQNVPTLHVVAGFGEWRWSKENVQRHNSIEGLSVAV
jgi:hypothetical protein